MINFLIQVKEKSMKLLSKISLAALMVIASLALAAQQDAKTAVEALATDINKLRRDWIAGNSPLMGEQEHDKLLKEHLAKFVKDIENGKIPKEAINYYMPIYSQAVPLYQTTPFFESIGIQDLNLIRKMIKLGADADLPAKGGTGVYSTPLIRASEIGNQPLTAELIKATKNINNDDSGYTALMSAAARLHPLTVQQLVDAGADANIKNKQGETALDIVQKKRNNPLFQITEKQKEDLEKVVKILEQAQAKK
jgi:hypothetical protein